MSNENGTDVSSLLPTRGEASDLPEYAEAEAFARAIKDIINPVGVSWIKDGIDGTLFFAYRAPVLNNLPEEAKRNFVEGLRTILHFAFQTYTMQFELAARQLDAGKELEARFTYPDRPDMPPVTYKMKDGRYHVEVEKRRGTFSPWTKPNLERAIESAMTSLPKQSERTYDNVNAVLVKAYPKEAPTSSESLKKLVKRLEIDWKELKKGK